MFGLAYKCGKLAWNNTVSCQMSITYFLTRCVFARTADVKTKSNEMSYKPKGVPKCMLGWDTIPLCQLHAQSHVCYCGYLATIWFV